MDHQRVRDSVAGKFGARPPMRMPRVHTFVQVRDALTVIGLTGDPDPAARLSFLAELRELAEVCTGELVVDLLACTDLTAAFLAELLAVRALCARHRCTLVVRVRDGYPSGDAWVHWWQQA